MPGWRAAGCNYGNYCQSSPSSHPLTSISYPNGTCPQHPEGTGRGQAAERSGRQGPLEPEKHANPGGLQLLWSLYAGEPRITSSSPRSRQSSHLSARLDHSFTVQSSPLGLLLEFFPTVQDALLTKQSFASSHRNPNAQLFPPKPACVMLSQKRTPLP